MISIKLSYGDELRRLSADSIATLVELRALCIRTFSISPTSFAICYVDNDGDKVTIGSDDELREALRIFEVSQTVPKFTVSETAPAPVEPEATTPVPDILSGLLSQVSDCSGLAKDQIANLLGQLGQSLQENGTGIESILRQFAQDEPDEDEPREDTAAMQAAEEEATEEKEAEEEATEGPVAHPNVVCDGCEMCPIVGPRFKCGVCQDVDYCEECEKKGLHDDHPLLKINHPGQNPKGIVVVLDEEQQQEEEGEFPAPPCGPWGWRHRHRGFHPPRRCWGRGRGRGGRGRGMKPFFRGLRKAFAGIVGSHGRECWRQQQKIHEQEAARLQEAIAESLKQDAKKIGKPRARVVKQELKTRSDGKTDSEPEIAPGKPFFKVFNLVNTGGAAWPEDTKLIRVSGDSLGFPDSGIPVGPVAPGEEMAVSVELVAPQDPGRYKAYFRLRGDNRRFGHRMWTDIFTDKDSAVTTSGEGSDQEEAVEPTAPALPEVPVVEEVPAEDVPAHDPITPFDHALHQLMELGFDDQQRCLLALNQANGSVQGALEILFS